MDMLTQPPRENEHKLGDLNATVIMVEYGDYECPHSSKAALWIPVLLKEFGTDLCYVYRHFPMSNIHPHSALAAMSAEAAGLDNKFWEMHKLLMGNFKVLSSDIIVKLAQDLSLDIENFLLEMESDKLIDYISQDIMGGEESGVISTPTFFLNNLKMEGPLSLEILRQNIRNLMAGQRLSA